MPPEDPQSDEPTAPRREPRTHTVYVAGIASSKATITGELSVYEAAAESAREREHEAEVSWRAQLMILLGTLGALLVAGIKAIDLGGSARITALALMGGLAAALVAVLPKVLESRRSRRMAEPLEASALSPGVRSLGERLARQRHAFEHLARTSNRAHPPYGR